ncbi:DNA-directed DNA polymerase [Tanacetum coccineum]
MSLHDQRRNYAWTQDFSKIARPLTKLLEKDTPFEFNDECQKAFESLKEKLTRAPVIVSPNWNLPFELMCDASDFAVGAILDQKDEFDIEIKDRKGTKNVASDHLSRIKNDESSDDSDVDDNFPEETLMEINTKNEPWFADFANYLVAGIIPKGMTYQQKNKFFSDLKHYFWEEPYLFKNATWFKDKAMLAEAQESDQILDKEQIAFLADPSIPYGQASQTTIPNTTTFQTKDLDAYDSNCDECL